jgi:UDP-3-O-[3-hydroxymyristoyl] glucosamine N-acyltransferase
VAGDVPDGQTVLGSPAMPIGQCRRVYVLTSKLPELADRVKELEGQAARLSKAAGAPAAAET